jgi:hypothetical protein
MGEEGLDGLFGRLLSEKREVAAHRMVDGDERLSRLEIAPCELEPVTGSAERGLSTEAETRIREAVAAAHANGRSWARIGMVLGVSRQAARERYGQDADIRRT